MTHATTGLTSGHSPYMKEHAGVHVLRRRDGTGFAEAVRWDGGSPGNARGNLTAIQRLVPEAGHWPRPEVTVLRLPAACTPGRRPGTGRMPGLLLPGEWVIREAGVAWGCTRDELDAGYELEDPHGL